MAQRDSLSRSTLRTRQRRSCRAIGFDPDLRHCMGRACRLGERIRPRIWNENHELLRHRHQSADRPLQLRGAVRALTVRGTPAALCPPSRQCAVRSDVGRERVTGRFSVLYTVLTRERSDCSILPVHPGWPRARDRTAATAKFGRRWKGSQSFQRGKAAQCR